MTAAVWLGIAALVVALGAAFTTYRAKEEARRSADAADRSAVAAEATDRRARTPKLDIALIAPAPPSVDRAIYRVRNDGPQDLESIVIHRPVPGDSITYPIIVTGGPGGWADDEIDLGRVALTQEVKFTLCCGPADELPEFRVRIIARSGADEWTLNEQLADPRAFSDQAPG